MAQSVDNMANHDGTDNKAIATRRKRRAASPSPEQASPAQLDIADEIQSFPAELSRTPSKPKKKVRFSDPGPELAGTASTGLTPAFNRASFDPYRPQPAPAQNARRSRRRSLPNLRLDPNTALGLSASPASATFSGEIQIMPWTDVMDERAKRRIRRNHMSELQTQYGAQRRAEVSSSKYEEEIKSLRAELARLKKQQMHSEAEGASSASKGVNREKELVEEIGRLKQEMSDQASNATPQTPVEPVGQAQTLSEDNLVVESDIPPQQHTESSLLPEDGLNAQAAANAPQQYEHRSSQASFDELPFDGSLRSARLQLEYLFPGEITLPLEPGSVKSLLDVMLERLNTLRTRALIADDAETTARMSETNIRKQFNQTLEQLKRARHYAEETGATVRKERASAEKAEQRAASAEEKADLAQKQAAELGSAADERESSNQKLQKALESYRSEVKKLETLIVDLEKEQDDEKAKLKAEMDEAIADLECHVAAETTCRREAETALEHQEERIKELQVREQELKGAVHDKQVTIRRLEKAFEKQTTENGVLQRENKTLNAQVVQLKHNVAASDERYEQADEHINFLVKKIKEEKAAAIDAIARVQEEINHAQTNTTNIQAEHAEESRKRSADALEHKGLLTPTIFGGRFRDGDQIEDMEGIEVQRGNKAKALKKKKRPDSGIVILEEDEDEYEDPDLEMTEF